MTAQAAVIPHGTTGAIIVAAGPVPPLDDAKRLLIARLMHGPVSSECKARLAGVLAAESVAEGAK